jgi:RimJ/RimL family protein N-acetyltransferase
MADQIPIATIKALARSVFKEATKYGFGQLDVVRLVNELMDECTTQEAGTPESPATQQRSTSLTSDARNLPLTGNRLKIRSFDATSDLALLQTWMSDSYGRDFVLSSMSARSVPIEMLVQEERNHLGVITTPDDEPIGALAYLDHDIHQRKAELRKLIGNLEYRGKGYAEEATRLWIAYGVHGLSLDKIYVSTLQANLGNIKLNENVGFQVEGLLRDEVLIDGVRHDVLRMGFCRDSNSPS